jgi:hypothetical protein
MDSLTTGAEEGGTIPGAGSTEAAASSELGRAVPHTLPPRLLLGVRAYARHRGVSHVAVIKAIAANRISSRDGKIDPEVADREWPNTTDPSRKPIATNGKARARPAPAPQVALEPTNGSVPPEMPLGTGEDGLPGVANIESYAKARAEREAYLAQLAKLDYETTVGKLVDAEVVKKTWFEAGRKVREAVLSVADRISPLVTGLADVAEVHRVITHELRIALETLALDE